MNVVKVLDKRKWGILSLLVICCLFFNYRCLGLDLFGVRLLGAFAQLGGIVIIAIQLDKKVYHHSQRSLWSRLLDFFGLGQKKGKTISPEGETLEMEYNSPKVKSVPKMEIKAIFEHFKKEIEEVYQDIEKTRKRLKKIDDKQQEQIKELYKSLQREIITRKDSNYRDNVASAGLEVFGLCLLVVGVFFASVPECFIR